jgi:hypothetical protein
MTNRPATLGRSKISRPWLRRCALTLSITMAAGILALVGLFGWAVSDTVSVVVVDENGNAIDGVAIQPAVVSGMTDATDTPTGTPVIFDVEALQRASKSSCIAFIGAGPWRDPNSWQSRTREWLSRFTERYGIVMAWNPESPVYAATGGVRVPRSLHFVAVSRGNLQAKPQDVFAIDAAFGRPPGGVAAKIVIRRLPPPVAWLDKRVTWDLRDVALDDFCRAIEAESGVPIAVDWDALQEEGIPRKYTFDLEARDLPLRSVLGTWARQLNLTFLETGSTIRITSQLEAGNWFETRLYSVGDLQVDDYLREDGLGLGFDGFVTVTIAPNTWQAVGGAGDLFVFGPERTMVVSQTQQAHREIEQLLNALRAGVSPPLSDDDRKIQGALAKSISLDCNEKPLDQVLSDLGRLAGIPNMWIDRNALQEEEVPDDFPVTLRLQDIRLDSALQHLLGPLNLASFVRDGFLVITSEIEAGNMLEPRIYQVADLVDDGVGGTDFDFLTELIGTVVTPNSWPFGPVSIQIFPPTACLVVPQTQMVHAQIERLLAVLRNGAGGLESAEDARLREILATRSVSLSFRDEPLDRAIRRIGELVGISNIILDRPSLEDEGLAASAPVSLQVENTPLSAALAELLGPLKLAAVVRADALVVVGAAEALGELRIRVYPVADLITDASPPDVLTETITHSVAATSWSDVGGEGVIHFFPNRKCLVVLQTDPILDAIESCLAELRNGWSTEERPD